MSCDSKFKSPIEILRESVAPSRLSFPTPPQPRNELTLGAWDASNIHKAMISTYETARKANDAAKLAQHNAFQAQMRAYRALSAFESELLTFEERTGIKPGAPYVTIDCEDDNDPEVA